TMATAAQLIPSSNSTRALARRARRCAADPSRASSIRSCRNAVSRKPGRIIQPVESGSGRLARGDTDSQGVGVSSSPKLPGHPALRILVRLSSRAGHVAMTCADESTSRDVNMKSATQAALAATAVLILVAVAPAGAQTATQHPADHTVVTPGDMK